MPVQRSFCRFCHANCAILVETEGDHVVRVSGDPEDPVFGGYTCIKGRQLPEAHHHPERLMASQKKTADGFVPIASEAALDEIAARLKALIDEHGPDSVAIYAGTYAFQNSAGVASAMAFAQGLGTRHFYTSVTLDQPAKVYTAFQYGQWQGGGHVFGEADVALFIGNNPIVSHYGPPGGLPPFSPSRRLRDAIEGGLKLIVADPRTSDVAALAHIHLAVKPGEDPALLAGMIHVILDERLCDEAFVQAHVDGLAELKEAVSGFPPAIAAARAGVSQADLVAAARMFAGGTKGSASTGTGPEMAGNGTLTQYLVSSLNILCGRFCREGEKSSIPRIFTPVTPRRAQVAAPMKLWGEGFAASRFRGLTHLMNEMPCNVLADEILTPGEGQIRALVSIGGNPMLAFPDQDKMARAVQSLDLFVSVDIRSQGVSARRSDYILAPLMCLERDDISSLSEWWYEIPYARYTEALIARPGDLLDEYEMLWELAKRLGTGLPLAGGLCPMDVCPDKQSFLDMAVAGCVVAPSQVRADSVDGRAVIYDDKHPIVEPAEPGHNARFDLAGGAMPAQLMAYGRDDPAAHGYPFRLISRRSRHRFNSTGGHLSALAAKRTTNPAHIHPDDLAGLGVTDGEMIRIASPHGEVHALAKASDALRRGVISMAHGYGDPDVGPDEVPMRGGSTNRLVCETSGYDPITGQALQSAIPVKVQRV
ncbi:molybdopterin-containing oxidoreductase family protein [Blastomonas aquatica]|uniref:Molybdopterin-binding oxidoreductase n=1 Tax=Blastomonas aquatica TaxID=1510276 RepID=A0ABQ1IVE2_9SPHN|nr:molybdopterin-dependent oxidoreductase [Blastomonas aquatica]GGB53293.1 molybdopterin-binding oxidoreductase [Blastomonas aquatica]